MSTTPPKLAIATRLHLGHASHPPPTHQLETTLTNFINLAQSTGATIGIVAVDAQERIEGYSLLTEVENICRTITTNNNKDIHHPSLEIIPVQPWGKFVPALNAIVAHSARRKMQCLLLVSAEVGIRGCVMERLWEFMDLQDTLVVGAVLQGHHHHQTTNNPSKVELTGRTCPWNTFALWNLHKLSLTGFLQVSEGLHGDEGIAGIEEVGTIATLQHILSWDGAKAKLISLELPNEVIWGQDFKEDEARREWHERKMQSKESRARRQLELMGLSGTVLHF